MHRYRALLRLLCVATGMALGLCPAFAQAAKVDVGKFMMEMTQLQMNNDTTTLAIWIPFEFVVAAGMLDGTSRAEVERSIDVLKGYQLVVVQCSTDQADGTSVYADEKAVLARAALRAHDGQILMPLQKVPPMVTVLVDAMKVMFASEGDAGGKNMHVLIFPAKTPDGKALVTTAARDSLALGLRKSGNYPQTVFTWHTPFDAVAGEQACAKCREKLSAKWRFCPWCGEKAP